jgi:hypothetical protein
MPAGTELDSTALGYANCDYGSTATTGMLSKKPSLLPSAPLGPLALPPSTLPTSTRVKLSQLSPSFFALSKPSTTWRLSLATPSLCLILRFRWSSQTSPLLPLLQPCLRCCCSNLCHLRGHGGLQPHCSQFIRL